MSQFPEYDFLLAFSSRLKKLRPSANGGVFVPLPDKKEQCPAYVLDFPGDTSMVAGASSGLLIRSEMRIVAKFARWVDSKADRMDTQRFYSEAKQDLHLVLLTLRLNPPDGFFGITDAPIIGATPEPLEQSSQNRIEIVSFAIQNLSLQYVIQGDLP